MRGGVAVAGIGSRHGHHGAYRSRRSDACDCSGFVSESAGLTISDNHGVALPDPGAGCAASNEAEFRLPLADELEASRLLRRVGLDGRARVERLGTSRAGRPIDLITIGDGPRTALIVGAPHPNEPTGCLTIERLLTRLASQEQFPEATGWQWNFIPAIDIDGIAWNEAWFRGPRTVDRYLQHFYRPPFRLQPEYSFPLDVADYRFAGETPESACWRAAIDRLRPHLQCALHGADTGGSFFLLSQESAPLAAELVRLPAAFGVNLNEFGESNAGMTVYQPGVLSFPAVSAFISRAGAAGSSPRSVWNAGDSSAGYARLRYGTFSMTCEVPLWRDAREGRSGSSGQTMREVIDRKIRDCRQDEQVLATSLPAVRSAAESAEAQALLAALEDAYSQLPGALAELEAAHSEKSADRILTFPELVSAEGATANLRTMAMLARLARLTNVSSAEATASSYLTARLDAYTRTASPSPVSLGAATDVQMAAVLTTARSMP